MSEIKVSDLNLVCQIIQGATTKGVFQAGDLEVIGALYNKFKKIVDENSKPPVGEAAAEPEPEASDKPVMEPQNMEPDVD